MKLYKNKLIVAIGMILLSFFGFKFLNSELLSYISALVFTIGLIAFIDSVKKIAKMKVSQSNQEHQ